MKSIGFIESVEFVGFVELRKNTIDPRNPSNSINGNLDAECPKERS